MNSEEKIIREVANKYHSLLRKNNFFPDFNQELGFYDLVSTSCRDHLPWEMYILNVETCYFAMPYHLRKIIKYDYFYRNYSFWWEEFYTRKQYSSFKKEAIATFVNNLTKMEIIRSKENDQYEVVVNN